MKVVNTNDITKAVKDMCVSMSHNLPKDVMKALEEKRANEDWQLAKDTLTTIIDNDILAEDKQIPMCQDTGMVVAFVKIGQDVKIEGGWIEDAINEGIRQAYVEAYLRKSVVKDPLRRVNTNDNTPGIINYEIVPGDTLEITVAAKGFGSENMSRQKMLRPADGLEGVVDFVVETAKLAGPNACPPIVVGVGIGGSFDRSTLLAKKALMRKMDSYNEDEYYKDLEIKLEKMINELGIGPQGFGGKTTCLRVLIETAPTHIAGLPVAVNINCHATRHETHKF
ncbi:MAG: fumarate hydratase [Ezakiella sp.]|nr:fumarate hydratase [Ezakiella sp.]MDD7471270.1 fumarate hydratase [Bacillota bacterium]MDY3923659.1 fumarate hydratase [Ezakiella sp.]